MSLQLLVNLHRLGGRCAGAFFGREECHRQELFVVGYLLFEVTQQFWEMPQKEMNNFPTNNK
jgi:hypothetical protein